MSHHQPVVQGGVTAHAPSCCLLFLHGSASWWRSIRGDGSVLPVAWPAAAKWTLCGIAACITFILGRRFLLATAVAAGDINILRTIYINIYIYIHVYGFRQWHARRLVGELLASPHLPVLPDLESF